MSTKVTIAHDKNFHLYQECWEHYDTVHLEVTGADLAASVSTNPNSLYLRLDIKTWRSIVEKWSSTRWAQNPKMDGTDPDADYDDEGLLKYLQEKLSE